MNIDQRKLPRESLIGIYIVISVTISFIALICGVLVGCLLKEKCTGKFMQKFEYIINFKTINNKNASNFDTNQNQSNQRHLNSYDFNKKIPTIHMGSQESPRNLSSSFETDYDNDDSKHICNKNHSDDEKCECCSTTLSQNDDSFGSSKIQDNSSGAQSRANSFTNNNNNNKKKGTFMKTNSECRDYFTVQNDYGILPVSKHMKHSYYTVNSPIYSKKINIGSMSNTNSNNNRLSSTSSSTDSSSYGVFNLVNSQTCLLNTSKDSSNYQVSKKVPLNNELNISEHSSIASTAILTPVSRLILTAEKPPLFQNKNCIVVNDDLEQKDKSDQNYDENLKIYEGLNGSDSSKIKKRCSYVSSSSSYSSPSGLVESGISSISSTTNWPIINQNSTFTINRDKYHRHHHIRRHHSIVSGQQNQPRVKIQTDLPSYYETPNLVQQIHQQQKQIYIRNVNDESFTNLSKNDTFLNNSYV